MPNRVLQSIARAEDRIDRLIDEGEMTAEKIEEKRAGLDMDIMEFCKFQEYKSLASTDGTLTIEEAQTIYGYLGESVDTFNSQSYAVKAMLTRLFMELLERYIGF